MTMFPSWLPSYSGFQLATARPVEYVVISTRIRIVIALLVTHFGRCAFITASIRTDGEIVTGNSTWASLPDVSSLLHSSGDALDSRSLRTQAPATATDDAEIPDVKDIWMIGLFPMKGSWAGGLGQRPAVEMGLEDVNADPNILPGYRLRMTADDTECDTGVGTNALYDKLYRSPTKIMVLGAGCSDVSEATSRVSQLWNLTQLSYSSASPTLSNKTIYRRFFRVFPPESSFNPAKLQLLEAFNWKRVGTLHEVNSIFSETTNDFMAKAIDRGIKIVTAESFTGDPRQQVRNLKKHGVRIIIGNFYENKARVIFCEAYKEEMYGAKYVWIITGFYAKEWWKINDPHNPCDCTIEQLEQAIQGYFTADALPRSLSSTPGLSGKTSKQFLDEYNNRTANSQPSGHQEAPYGYDSVWTAAILLNTSMTIMKEQGWNRNIEDFNYSDAEMSNLFWNLTSQINFEGVSGPVMFEEDGDRKGLTQIEQLQGDKEVQVGVFDPKTNDINWNNEWPVIWLDKSIPPDSITEKITPRVISVGLFILMTILAALGIVMSLFFLLFNIHYRHCKYIKMSSPNMNNFILVGAILAFSSIIFGGTNSNLVTPFAHLVMCKCYNWTLALGFSLAFGAMFSKTWRVHKIFTNKKIQRMVIKDYQLMAIVCVLVMLDVLILGLWELLYPLHIVVYNKTMELSPDPYNDNQVLIPQSRFCESSHMWHFAGVLYFIKGLLLVFGAFLAFETRKVTVPALNDSKFIGISVYNVVVLCLIGVPTAYMIKEQVDAAYTLISLFTFFATTLTICLIFIPKVLKRNREPHSGTRWSKGTDNKRNVAASATISVTCSDGSGSLTVGEVLAYKRELEQLREENQALKEALEECQCRLTSVEAGGCCDGSEVRLHFVDLPSPAAQTVQSDLTVSTEMILSSSPAAVVSTSTTFADDVAVTTPSDAERPLRTSSTSTNLQPPSTSNSIQSFYREH